MLVQLWFLLECNVPEFFVCLPPFLLECFFFLLLAIEESLYSEESLLSLLPRCQARSLVMLRVGHWLLSCTVVKQLDR